MSIYVLQISAGSGPAEARAFAASLAQRLERLCERRGLAVLDASARGDEEAPRSVTLRVAGDALAALGGERGSHCLVQRSAARGRSSRKRWFVAVTLHATSAEEIAGGAAPRRDELEVTACRAGGPGGQHVNKVSTAVRVRHRPSGICVRAASERSQKANLARAVERLASLLAEEAHARRDEVRGACRRAHGEVTRGDPVRTWVQARDGRLVAAS